MPVTKVYPEEWYLVDDSYPLCGKCAIEELEKTAKGEYTGDEVVTIAMLEEIADADTEPYQCEICLTQNDAYEELGEDE